MIIYTKPDFDASQIYNTSEFSEHLIIRIPLRGKDELTLVGIYKAPDTSSENAVALHKLLMNISNISSHILITGYFIYREIHGIAWSTYENTTRNNYFMEAVRATYLHQQATVATRFRVGYIETTWSTNRDTVSARTRCVEPISLRVGPRGPITKAANRRNITRKQKQCDPSLEMLDDQC